MYQSIVQFGIIHSSVLSVFIISTIVLKPDVWIVKYLDKEKRATYKKSFTDYILMWLFVFLMIATPVWFTFLYTPETINIVTYFKFVFYCYVLNTGFNVVDLFLIDLPICLLKPGIRTLNIPPSAFVFKNHMVDFFKGLFLLILPSSISAGFGITLSYLFK